LPDEFSAHVSDDVIDILAEARVHIVTFAPYTTQIFQVLHLTLFLIPKGCPRSELPFDDGNAMVTVIMKVYYEIRHTMMPSSA
jgi:hypothetical protein